MDMSQKDFEQPHHLDWSVGDKVKTQSGLIGTIVNIFFTKFSVVCEVELDCGGLMHYNSNSLIKI